MGSGGRDFKAHNTDDRYSQSRYPWIVVQLTLVKIVFLQEPYMSLCDNGRF